MAGSATLQHPTDLQREIETLVQKHGSSRSSLMPILHDVNRSHSYVSEEAMNLIAVALNMPRAEIYGVVTFYSFLSVKPRGKHVIRLCRTVSCDMQGTSREVVSSLRDELGIDFGQTTPDNLFTLEMTNCIGQCDQGPAMLVGEDVHIRLTASSVRDIVRRYRKGA